MLMSATSLEPPAADRKGGGGGRGGPYLIESSLSRIAHINDLELSLRSSDNDGSGQFRMDSKQCRSTGCCERDGDERAQCSEIVHFDQRFGDWMALSADTTHKATREERAEISVSVAQTRVSKERRNGQTRLTAQSSLRCRSGYRPLACR